MNEVKFSGKVFDSALYVLPDRVKEILQKLPICVKNSAYEIRLRAERPVMLTSEHNFYITTDSVASVSPPPNPLIVTAEELYEVLTRLTGHSVYTRIDELREGYVSMKNGHRAGVCGRFQGGYFRDVSSVNIRIAREVIGAAESLYDKADKGILIAGGPGTGKTTLLRDLVRHLSDGGKRVSLIDIRGELAAAEGGRATLDVGCNTDIISGGEKARGAEIALRTLYPEIIAFDEIGTSAELELVAESFFSGVTIITSAHASTMEELMSRNVTKRLIESGAVGTVALLSSRPNGKITIVGTDFEKAYA